jgi:hypothetical protein
MELNLFQKPAQAFAGKASAASKAHWNINSIKRQAFLNFKIIEKPTIPSKTSKNFPPTFIFFGKWREITPREQTSPTSSPVSSICLQTKARR